MPRYIDAEKLKAHYSWWANGSEEYQQFKKVFDTIIDVQPTTDVVEVVRCKECKRSSWDELGKCYWCKGKERTADFFCADGERGEDGGEF